MRLLLAENEVSLTRALSAVLEHNNYTVDVVYDGEEAISYIENYNYDGIILDIMMPKIDGISVLKHIREKGNTVPVIILTAKSEIDDKVLGLDLGANDYMTKPFSTRELLARIRAMTRTQTIHPTCQLKVGNLTLNQTTFILSTENGEFRLTNKEFQMMELLMANPQQLITSERFFEKIWGYDSDTELNVIWVYISYLRKKLIALKANIQIKATRNIGYSLEEIK